MTTQRAGYGLMAPAFGVYLLTGGLPLLWMLRLSLFDSGFFRESWVGLGNYLEACLDPAWWRSFANTGIMIALVVPAETLLAVWLSLMLVNESKRFQTWVRFSTYLPGIVSGVILSLVYMWIFATDGGVVNWTLGLFGIEPVVWFVRPWSARGAIAAIMVMLCVGGQVVVLLAAVLGIDRSQYDAAHVDGASWSQIRRHIVLPAIWWAVALQVLFGVLGVAQMWYLPYLLTSGGPAHATETVVLDIYLSAFGAARYGYAAAKSVMLATVIGCLSVVTWRMQRR